MDPRSRRLGLAVALCLTIALDVAIRRLDLFGPLVSDALPSTLFATLNTQVTDVIRSLRGVEPGSKPVLLVGNSLLDMGARPLPELRRELIAAGAPDDTRIVPLMVFASVPTDAEVLSRHLDDLQPGLVLLGLGATDVGTDMERARHGPLVRILESDPTDGLITPSDLENRLDRWARSVWALYRYRALFADLLFPVRERRTPRAFYESTHDKDEFFVATAGPDRAREIAPLREAYERGGRWEDVERYVTALQGPAYVPGLRDRWRALEPQALQLEALRRFVAQVRAAGGRPVWVLMPENPAFEEDPEVGPEVRARSDATAAALRVEADALGVDLIDLRHGTPREGFLDLNHLFYEHGGLAPRLARALGERGLLGPQP